MGQILDFFGSMQANKAQQKAADKSIAASTAAQDKSIGLQKEMFERIWNGSQVQRDAGNAATRQMAALMGLNIPSGTTPTPANALATSQAITPASNETYGGANKLNAIAVQYGLQDDPRFMAQDAGSIGTGQVGMAQPVAENALAGPAAPATSMPQSTTDWLRSTPGYQFNFDEGARALNTSLASRGRLFSGEAGREAIRYGQNYGDRIYGDQMNRLAGIAGLGQTATSQGSQAGQNYANNGQNALQWNANNLASSYQNKADSTSGFWGDISGSFGGNAMAKTMGSFMKGFGGF